MRAILVQQANTGTQPLHTGDPTHLFEITPITVMFYGQILIKMYTQMKFPFTVEIQDGAWLIYTVQVKLTIERLAGLLAVMGIGRQTSTMILTIPFNMICTVLLASRSSFLAPLVQ